MLFSLLCRHQKCNSLTVVQVCVFVTYSQGANEETDEDANFWDFQWCSEMFMPMTRDGKEDMFWPQVRC